MLFVKMEGPATLAALRPWSSAHAWADQARGGLVAAQGGLALLLGDVPLAQPAGEATGLRCSGWQLRPGTTSTPEGGAFLGGRQQFADLYREGVVWIAGRFR